MVIAKKFGDESIFESSARITISDGSEATTLELDTSEADEAPGAEYWVAGCVSIIGQSYSFIPVNKFYEENPLTADNTLRLYCDELVKSGAAASTTPQPFCDNAMINVVVFDAVTFDSINANVGISLLEDEEKTVRVIADDAVAE